jgi:hypothetical protein
MTDGEFRAASLARLDRETFENRDYRNGSWGDGVIREAKRQLARVLDGVGQAPTVGSMRKVALHMRRSLSEAEMETLDPCWLAIPARDEFSEDGEIAMEL